MTKPLRGAKILAQSLARLGCRRVFTLSGNHIMSDAAIETDLGESLTEHLLRNVIRHPRRRSRRPLHGRLQRAARLPTPAAVQ